MEANRYRGCLLGLAAGDALGVTLENEDPGTFTPITTMLGGGRFMLQPGQWTDDTSMALCMAASLVEKEGFDANDQMERFLRWRREGYMSSGGECFDISTTVGSALSAYERSGDPYSGSTDPRSASNGSLMRVAPIPMCFAFDPPQAMERCAEASATTHGLRVCMDACRYLGGLIIGALNGVPKKELLSPLYSPVPGYWEENPLPSELDAVARGSFKSKHPPDIKGTSYVVDSLEAVLWAFYLGETFEEGALMAVNLGDDADTTGAIFGQLAGAYYGEKGIPTGWLIRLTKRKLIETLADKLFALSGQLAEQAKEEGEEEESVDLGATAITSIIETSFVAEELPEQQPVPMPRQEREHEPSDDVLQDLLHRDLGEDYGTEHLDQLLDGFKGGGKEEEPEEKDEEEE